MKSQIRGSVDVFVSKRVRWSHKFVLLGPNKDRMTYNRLSPIQWMASFCRTIKEASNIDIRGNMLDYVINLMDDAKDFSWASTKASHAILLCHMEQGEIVGLLDTDKIDSQVGSCPETPHKPV